MMFGYPAVNGQLEQDARMYVVALHAYLHIISQV